MAKQLHPHCHLMLEEKPNRRGQEKAAERRVWMADANARGSAGLLLWSSIYLVKLSLYGGVKWPLKFKLTRQ